VEIPLGVQVLCADGICGRSLYVLVNPVLDKVTHLVIREQGSEIEYIVPIGNVSKSIPNKIILRCSKSQLELMEPFIKTQFVEEKVLDRTFAADSGRYRPDAYFYLPYVTPETGVELPVAQRQIPPDELAIHRGASVEAKDGAVGRVDEFVVEAEHGCITHLVMRQGHLWGRKDVIIPASAIADIQENAVHLKLDKQQVGNLPGFAIHRRWS
jgi:sporulation protein YlmC with PRC-barrel domain